MIAVFGGFILGDERVIKLFGIGLASAIFLDAFVVRTVLVPALMHLIGKANWYYPAWLDRITPRLSIEAADWTVDDPIGGSRRANRTRNRAAGRSGLGAGLAAGLAGRPV